MSWHFSRALGEAYSEGACLDGAPYVPLKLTPTQSGFLSPDRMTAFSRLSRFGMTFAPLTEEFGEVVLMSFREDFPARTSAPQDEEPASKDCVAGYGRRWHELLARYDLDSHSWRTHLSWFPEGLQWSSVTLPRWGMMRGGVCWGLDISGLGIYGKESGCWLPTIGKNEFRGTSRIRYKGSDQFRGAKMAEALRTCETDPTYLDPQFGEAAMGWPDMWTALAPLEMDKYHAWLRLHGKS